jgi:hypothetical protein
MLPSEFVYLGVLIQIIGGSSYILDTFKGRVKPNRVTWLLWALAPFIAFFAMISKGVGVESLATLIIGLIPLLVLIASFFNKTAIWRIERFDLICGAISIFGLLLWILSKEGNIAIMFSIIADIAAAAPTLKKSYTNPESESYSAYLAGTMNAIFALLTIKVWNFENYGFQLYWFFMSLTITTLILRGKVKKSND